MNHAEIIAKELSLKVDQVERTLALFQGGATLPFVARYRKEVTGNLDEVALESISTRATYLDELDGRKETVRKEIESQGKLTPELKARIDATLSKTELEDLYLPFKPKRRTRATIARDRGLQPLADRILAQADREPPRDELAAPFLSAEVVDTAAAFAGARDIVAETVAERAEVRASLRQQALESGSLVSRSIAGQEEAGAKFKDYFDYREPASAVPSHRLLALRRGEREGFLRVSLEVDEAQALALVERQVRTTGRAALAEELTLAMADSYARLLKPAIEVDVRLSLKERADAQAITVFAENLRNLLLASPLGGKRVLALDPGFRTGCKVVVLDEKGDLKDHTVVYPSQSERKMEEARTALAALCRKYRIEAVAIGNGTAGRETETFVRGLMSEGQLGSPAPIIVVVNEAGASVYSASEVARAELPNEDVTVRGAVSIGRRLQDPLAELVKIDPKSIGVGQYQHDVHQPALKKALDMVVESCVNRVGVNLNTASAQLLRYVAGVGENLAHNIVAHRGEKGRFESRRDLLKVPRFGPKAFEQAAGFLRLRGTHPLDNSAVHPESYEVVERMARDLSVEVKDLVGSPALARRIEIERYVQGERGLLTLKDIVAELEKPGRDPRAEFEAVSYDPQVTEFDHVKEGMVLEGVVTNVTQFGAFVDVGVHQDGLVHVSELAHRFVRDPADVVKVGERVKVKVIKVDAPRHRIGLSIKQATAPAAPAETRAKSPSPEGPRPKPKTGGLKPPDGGRGRDSRPAAPARAFNNPFQAALSSLKVKK